MYCPECGCELSEGARFCKKCGTSIPTEETARAANAAKTAASANTAYTAHAANAPSVAAGLLNNLKAMKRVEQVVLAAAPVTMLLALFAPWYNLTQIGAFAGGLAGINPRLTLIDEIGALQKFTSLSSSNDYMLVVVGILVIAMIASFVLLALFVADALRTRRTAEKRAIAGFSVLAATVLVHNITMILFSTGQVYTASVTIGSPSAFSWVILALCAGALGCVIYMSRAKSPLFAWK